MPRWYLIEHTSRVQALPVQARQTMDTGRKVAVKLLSLAEAEANFGEIATEPYSLKSHQYDLL